MTYDKWVETFNPIKNQIRRNTLYDGHLFGMSSEEIKFIRAQPSKVIWTVYYDDDLGETNVFSGYHHGEASGFFITKIPFDIKDLDTFDELGLTEDDLDDTEELLRIILDD